MSGTALSPLLALWTRHAPWLLLAASAATLGAALVSQYVFGLAPCVLCIYQRWPYVAVMVLAAGAWALGRNPKGRAALLGLCAVALLIGTGIAVYHVGVEQHWWQGTAECTADSLNEAKTVDQLRAMLETAPVVRCDEVAWSLFGISMAGYNVLVSLGLAALSLIAAVRTARGTNP
jgi:disulfide bond formation protein DsbB